ncbi:uncharacterized protein LOC106170523, partial [Lingula anatina]|uniref:Uncharacterized protein LOC106170523 n=1 Tax=Lingula anatina TaxID=7574 RepID=A0A1S3J613_LINAN
PLTHHFLGNILAAKQNISGAIYHYEEALKADPNNQDFLNMLRTVKCYQKYHQNNQNPARKESTGQQKCGPPGQPNSKETESRIVCKAEHGKETCILETRTRNLPGQCQQSCDMKPECKCQCPDTLIRKLEKAVADEANGAQMCIHNTMDPQANSPLNMMFDPELEMEKIGQLYKDIGICKSPECEDHNLMQPANSRPHIRLENINGLITQNLVFSDSPSEVKVSPEECIIFKDGKKSDGCAQEIFKPMADQLSVFHQKFEELDRATCDHANTASSSSTTNNNNNNNKIEKDKKKDSIKSNDSKVPKKNKEKPMLQPVYLQSDDPSDLEEVINAAIEQVEDVQLPDIPDSELPDTTKHIVARKALSIPTWDECQDHKKIDFKKFTSTWLSVTAKGIDPKHHVNFSKKIRGEWEEPVCEKDFGASAQSLDHIKGIAERNSLEYAAETGLKEVLQSLGDDDGEPGEVVGTRIAHALKKNGTSWVLGNLAALYWRVEGNAKHAVNCLRMALNTAPRDMRDISLLSMANVLYKSGRLNDAIVVINMALETSPRIVVIHFTLANIYAAKGDWPKAVMFYESTLGLQSSFEPARDRLKAIQCKKILEHPEEYKPKEEGKKKKKGKSKPKD